MSAVPRIAEVIRAGARAEGDRRGRHGSRGRITALTPLTVDLLGIDLTLNASEVELSADVLRYDASEGLQVGDALALVEVGEGDWIAVAVLSDTTIRPVPA